MMTQLQVITNDDLTTPERTRLGACEGRIEKGLATFIEVGGALLEIRDSRLYRETHSTFENYCRDRWGMSGTHAHRLVDAATVVTNIGTHQLVSLPTTESQARPLAKLEPEQQLTAWEAAVATADTLKEAVTAAIVSAAVEVIKKQPDLVTPETGAIIQAGEPDLVQAVIAEVTAHRPNSATVKRIRPDTQEEDSALWVWGRMKDFERDNHLAVGAKAVFDNWALNQKQDAIRLIGPILVFFNELENILHE